METTTQGAAMIRMNYRIETSNGTTEWVTVEHGPNTSIAEICELIGCGMDITILDECLSAEAPAPVKETNAKRTNWAKEFSGFRSNRETALILEAQGNLDANQREFVRQVLGR